MTLKEVADRKTAELKLLKEELVSREARLVKAERGLRHVLKARQVLQDLAQAVQQEAHTRIAGVVSKCLAAVFPSPYVFKIVFVKRRGKTEAELEFHRDGLVLKPWDGVGGSVLDVAALALRLACLKIKRPRLRHVLFMDEAFRGVSKRQGNKRRVRRLLETLSNELGFQMIAITHDSGLRAGWVVEV